MIKKQSSINRNLFKLWEIGRQPLFATIFGLLIGGIVIVISGQNPIPVFINMFDKSFIRPYYLLQTLTRSSPIIICGIATSTLR